MPAHSDRRFRFGKTLSLTEDPGTDEFQAFFSDAVCTHARYVFDEPVTVKSDEEIAIINGQYFKVEVVAGKEELTLIPGKWDN